MASTTDMLDALWYYSDYGPQADPAVIPLKEVADH
jgi:hypothetical protein